MGRSSADAVEKRDERVKAEELMKTLAHAAAQIFGEALASALAAALAALMSVKHEAQ